MDATMIIPRKEYKIDFEATRRICYLHSDLYVIRVDYDILSSLEPTSFLLSHTESITP